MSEPKMGAVVMYCGHNGWFVADIFKIGTTNVVKANGPVTAENIVRGRHHEATHHVSDMTAKGVVWMPERGVFVVPEEMVTEIHFEEDQEAAVVQPDGGRDQRMPSRQRNPRNPRRGTDDLHRRKRS